MSLLPPYTLTAATLSSPWMPVRMASRSTSSLVSLVREQMSLMAVSPGCGSWFSTEDTSETETVTSLSSSCDSLHDSLVTAYLSSSVPPSSQLSQKVTFLVRSPSGRSTTDPLILEYKVNQAKKSIDHWLKSRQLSKVIKKSKEKQRIKLTCFYKK